MKHLECGRWYRRPITATLPSMSNIAPFARRRHPFATGLAMGIVSSGTLAQVHNYISEYSCRSDRDRMRADWLRVGGDFDKVIASENVKAAARTP